MDNEPRNTSFTITSFVDCIIQTIAILFVVLNVVRSLAGAKGFPAIYALYGMLFLGIYQLMSAFVRSFYGWNGMYGNSFKIYWLSVVISLLLFLVAIKNQRMVREHAAYIVLGISFVVAAYYCTLCWNITLKAQNES